jgi:RND family efflux transporter MFP subunit
MTEEMNNAPQPEPKPENATETPQERKRWKTIHFVLIVAVVGLGLVVTSGIHARHVDAEKLEHDTQAAVSVSVAVVHPGTGAATDDLVLPANAQPYVDAPIYARTNGYLKRWYFDIGTHVKQGQLLAEIEAPELDQQLLQARASLQSAQADLQLAHTTAERWQNLLKTNSVSKQETDQAVSAYVSKQAAVDASEANVRRLEQLQAYEKIYAPFDGVITARETDIGDLIDAGSTPKELFHLAAIDRLRLFVAVPEVSASAIKDGAEVAITSDEYPSEILHGRIVRNSNSIDPASRTLNVEVDVENSSGKLLPGAYAFVHIKAPGAGTSLTIPSSTLLFRAEGLRVGVVRGNHAELVPIKIGRDFGQTVEVVAGLRPTDEVIVNPSDSLVSGAPAHVAEGAHQ